MKNTTGGGVNSLKRLILMLVAISSFVSLAYNLVWSPDWQVRRWPETRIRAVYTVSAALPAGLRTIDAEVTVADFQLSGIPTV